MTSVPGAIVFDSSPEPFDSFTFGQRQLNNEVHHITSNKNLPGYPEVGLITARSQMPFHAESLVSRFGFQKMSRSYFVNGRSTYLDPSGEGL